MAYEWKLTPRPYTDQEAKTLLTSLISPETTDWHYNTHHKGYVTALNNIEKGLESADRAAANGNYSIVGELKRRFTWNHAGALLHDVYWEVIGGDGDPKKGADVLKAIERDFGTFLRVAEERRRRPEGHRKGLRLSRRVEGRLQGDRHFGQVERLGPPGVRCPLVSAPLERRGRRAPVRSHLGWRPADRVRRL